MATSLPDDHPDKAEARRVLLAEAARLEAMMNALDDSSDSDGGGAGEHAAPAPAPTPSGGGMADRLAVMEVATRSLEAKKSRLLNSCAKYEIDVNELAFGAERLAALVPPADLEVCRLPSPIPGVTG